MIRFAHPEYLHILWLTPLLIAAIILELRWRREAMRSWAAADMHDAVLPERAPLRHFAKRILAIAAFVLLTLSAAGPQVGTRLVEITREGTDVVIALDVSKSMLAEDITPNRLSKARHEILKFLQMLRGDRVALVPFAGVAFVQVPLTLDYGAFGSVLNALEPGIIPHPGTALGEAIKQARRAFRTDGKAQKSLILITDGEDHEEGALEQAREAAKEGVIIFTVGMASQAGAPIPEKDAVGKIVGYKTERGGGTVVSRLNEKLLSDIADATGGEFYRDNPSGDEFRRIFEKLAGMDKQKFEQKQFTDYEDRFQWPLLLGFVLLFLEELIPPYRLRKKVIAAGLILLLTAFSMPSFAQSPRESASKGVKHYNKEEYDKALTEFLAGLEKAGDQPELRYDLGTALYRLQQFPEAAEAFNKAAQKNPKIAADAWYNLGNSMYEGQKFDDAVKAYKNALKLNHDDKDAKHNLELALRAKQMQMQQQPQPGQSGQDSTKQQQQQQKQQQQKGEEEKQQQEQQAQQAQQDSTKEGQPQPKPGEENKMSKEEAMQLLQALEGDEQEAQKEKLIRQFGEPKKVQKDW